MKTTHTSGQLRILLELLEQKGMTPERFQAVQGSGILADLFHPKANLDNDTRLKLQEMLQIPPSQACIEVDYGLTFSKMATRAGIEVVDDYCYKKNTSKGGGFNPDTLKGRGLRKIDIKFLYIGENCPLEHVEQKLEREGLIPARIEDLLATQARFPYLGRKFFLRATGTCFKLDHSERFQPTNPVIRSLRRGDQSHGKLHLTFGSRVADEYVIGISRIH